MEDKFKIQELPGKGLGLVSITFIPKSTRILSESPIFEFARLSTDSSAFDRLLDGKAQELSKDERESLLNLFNAYPIQYNRVTGIVRTNAVPLEYRPHTEFGIFLKVSRLNHSCDLNSHGAWNEETNQFTIQTFKDVPEGDEITITYLNRKKHYYSRLFDCKQNYPLRQFRLKELYNFTCTCTLCSQPPISRQERDARLGHIIRLETSMHSGCKFLNSPLSCIQDAHTMFQELQIEEVASAKMACLYYLAFEIVIAHSDRARAKVFLQKAYSIWVILQGDDHPDSRRLKTLADDPTKGSPWTVSRSGKA